MDWWVRRRTHACLLYAGDIILVVHGDLTVAPDANLGRRLGDHKGAKIRWNLRSSVCCGQLQSSFGCRTFLLMKGAPFLQLSPLSYLPS